MIRGVDVSENQDKPLPWPIWKSQSGIQFTIVRGSIGYRQDSMFVTHRTQARAAGLLTGVYHAILHHDPEIPFFDPLRQARVFAGRLGAAPDDELPAVVDVEADGITDALLWTFIQEFERLSPRRLMIYTSQSKWHTLIGRGKTRYSRFLWWIADYSGSLDLPDVAPKAHIRQTSGTGTLPAYTGNIDLDDFDGTLADLRRLSQPIIGEDFMPPIDEVLRLQLVAEAQLAKQAAIEAGSRAQRIIDLLPAPAPAPTKHTLATLTNQSVINLFSRAFGGLAELTATGLLNELASKRQALYVGPAIEDLPGLTQAQRERLIAAL